MRKQSSCFFCSSYIIIVLPLFFRLFRFSRWTVRVAEAIHLYEAWLALLAIVVWHLFFVMFRPGTFPVSFTVFTGRMEPSELQHEHPEEYERAYAGALSRAPIQDSAADEARVAEPHTKMQGTPREEQRSPAADATTSESGKEGGSS